MARLRFSARSRQDLADIWDYIATDSARTAGDWKVFGIGRRPLNQPDYASIDLSRPFEFPFTPDVVVHAAARSSPWGTHAEFIRHNIEATRRVIEFCEQRGRPKLIYI